jgi:hypothetical protein
MRFQKLSLWQRNLFPLLLGIGLIGCSPLGNLKVALSNPSVTPIRNLQQQHGQANAVYLKGKVSDRAPFLGSGAYQLQDETGTVWVITNKALPSPGEEIAIQGEVQYQSMAIGSQKLQELYIVELEQLERHSQPTSDDLFLPHK